MSTTRRRARNSSASSWPSRPSRSFSYQPDSAASRSAYRPQPSLSAGMPPNARTLPEARQRRGSPFRARSGSGDRAPSRDTRACAARTSSCAPAAAESGTCPAAIRRAPASCSWRRHWPRGTGNTVARSRAPSGRRSNWSAARSSASRRMPLDVGHDVTAPVFRVRVAQVVLAAARCGPSPSPPSGPDVEGSRPSLVRSAPPDAARSRGSRPPSEFVVVKRRRA